MKSKLFTVDQPTQMRLFFRCLLSILLLGTWSLTTAFTSLQANPIHLNLPPFACDGFYITHTQGVGFFGAYQIDGTVTNVGMVGSGVNATGYNVQDGFLYTIRGDEHLLRLHSDGSIDDLGDIGLPNNNVVGGFDNSGGYYVKSGDMTDVHIIDVTTLTFTTVTPSVVFFAKDWAFHPGNNAFYGVHASDLYAYFPATNTVTIQPITGLIGGDGNVFGATWYSGDGYIYVANNVSGNIYRILIDELEAHFVMGQFSEGGNDGASCPSALPPFPVICAHPDETCVPTGGSITLPILDNDDAHLTNLALNTFSILTPPAAGSVSYNPGTGELTYSYNGAPAVDEMTYQICGQSNNPQVCDYTTITFTPADPVTFDPLGPFCQGDIPPSLPAASNEGVTGSWSPATINTATTGTTTYTFTPTPSFDCAFPTTLDIAVAPNQTPVFSINNVYCQGETTDLLPGTSDNGISGNWSPATIDNQNSATYTFTPSGGVCSDDFTLNVTINPPVTPIFNLQQTYCQGATTQALPTVSDNNINGSWSPTTIDNQNSANYTFTPSAGQCASNITIFIDITPNVTTQFNLPTSVCEGGSVFGLPQVSDNNVQGSWSPATVNNQSPATYVFTPNAGECATTFSLDVSIQPQLTPAFVLTDEYCQGETVDALPTTSDNNISGAWSPTNISNQISGSYVFTPDDGICAAPFTLDVTINNPVSPIFSLTGSYCQGTNVAALPLISDNNISGSWSPATIDNQASGTYVFTPDNGICALTYDLDITIEPLITPEFGLTSSYCDGEITEQLPSSSDNGVAGSWSPATIDNQNSATYTFTPDPAECATVFELEVMILANNPSVFSLQDNYCQGTSIEALPTVDDNGISGSWTPTMIDNQNSATYTFTPDPGQCIEAYSLDVIIEPTATPEFSFTTTYCAGAAPDDLPTVSDNGIPGSWNPATIDNQNTATYVFTPDADLCAEAATIEVNIQQALTPEFSFATQFCAGTTVDALPDLSDNGITGSWAPAVIDNQNSGTYIFTPADGECALGTDINVQIDPEQVVSFSLTSSYCQDEIVGSLPATDLNGITGSWAPAVIDNQASATYTFTPDGEFCAQPFSQLITINEPPVLSLEQGDSIVCNSGSGSLVLEVNGNGGYDYTWSDPSLNGQQNPMGIPAGFYSVTVEDVNGCTAEADITILQPDPLTLNCSDTINPSVILATDGAVNLTFGGGTPDYELEWSGPMNGTASPTGNTFTIDGLGAGNYSVTITDANDCSTECNFVLNNPGCDLNVSSASINPTCANLNDGVIDLTITGSLAVTNIDWNVDALDGQENPVDLAVGTYTVVVTDEAGCSAQTSVELTAPEPIATQFSLITEYCAGATPEPLPAMDNNGIPGNWLPASIDNQNSGNYVFTPESGQCAENFTLNVLITPQLAPDFSLMTDYCAGDAVELLPMASPNGVSGTWNPAVIDNQNSGSYLFTPDDGQCAATYTLNVNINQPQAASFNLATEFCQGDVVPALSTTDLNGVSGSWSPAVIDNQLSATYLFTPDADQCTEATSLDIVIFEPPSAILILAQALSCNGGSDAALNLEIQISGILDFDWSDDELDGLQNPGGLTAGNYSVTITDENGCSTSRAIEITEPNPLSLDCSAVTNPTAIGNANGSVEIQVSGGMAAYTINWDGPSTGNGSITEAGTFLIDELPQGDYGVTVTDANNCETECAFVLTAPACEISLQLAGTDLSCNSSSDGSIDLTVEGNGEVNSIDWNDNNLDGIEDPSGLAAGTYTVTVSLNNGCSATADISLTQPEMLALDCSQANNPTMAGSANGSVTILPEGGTAPYQISYSGPVSGQLTTGVGSTTIEDMSAGQYQITLVDAMGCTSFCNFQLEEPIGCGLNVQLSANAGNCAEDPGTLIIDTIISGDGFYEYSLDGFTYNLVFDLPMTISVPTGTRQEIYFQDGNNCIDQQAVDIPSKPILAVDLGQDQVIRLGDSARLNILLNFSPLQWVWSDSSTISDLTNSVTHAKPLESTVYNLLVVDSLGCSASDQVQIIVDRRADIFIPNAFSPNGDGVNDLLTVFTDRSVISVTNFSVFDRWGEQVFSKQDIQPNDPNTGWDGSFRNKPLQTGVYVYVIELLKVDGNSMLLKGDVSLIR